MISIRCFEMGRLVFLYIFLNLSSSISIQSVYQKSSFWQDSYRVRQGIY